MPKKVIRVWPSAVPNKKRQHHKLADNQGRHSGLFNKDIPLVVWGDTVISIPAPNYLE